MQEVKYLLEQGLAVPSNSPWASPCHLVPKEDGQVRFCTDYRRVNAITVPDAYPLPRVDDLIDEVGQSKFIKKLDIKFLSSFPHGRCPTNISLRNFIRALSLLSGSIWNA